MALVHDEKGLDISVVLELTKFAKEFGDSIDEKVREVGFVYLMFCARILRRAMKDADESKFERNIFGGCSACGQRDHGQTGRHPCKACGLPMEHVHKA